MKRSLIGALLLIAGLNPACGKGSDSFEVVLRGGLPLSLTDLTQGVKLVGTLREDASSNAIVLSVPAVAASEEENTYRFVVDVIAQRPEDGGTFVVEAITADDAAVVVSRITLRPQQDTESFGEFSVSALSFDDAIDDDSDGLENLAELQMGLNPRRSDTDGDGVDDGLDVFPLLVTEWNDLDNDGVGDNADDDRDGDGLPNTDEDALGTDPSNFDTDNDGVGDADDNCRLAENTDQIDSDSNGGGDACQDDDDGDGLDDARERSLGTDATRVDSDSDGLGDGREVTIGSNPLVADTDRDGLSDASDNCPIASNPNQSDIDNDTAGDVCDGDRDGDGRDNQVDNCPSTVNADQADLDQDDRGDPCDTDRDGDDVVNDIDTCPDFANLLQLTTDADADGVKVECDLDETDPRVKDEDAAIFVNGQYGNDANGGTRLAPVATFTRAIALASQSGKDVYVAAGTYNVASVVVPSGIGFFGGFQNSTEPATRFSARERRSSDPDFETVVTRDDADVTLSLVGLTESVLSGFLFTNTATSAAGLDGHRTIQVDSGDPTLEYNVIAGNASSSRATGLKLQSSDATVTFNRIEGGGYAGSGTSSVAVSIEDGSPTMSNNLLIAGSGRFAIGIDIEDGTPNVVNNTIDARSGDASHGTSEGVNVTDASPILTDNLIFTGTAPDQYPVSCWGTEPTAEAEVSGNILATIPGGTTNPVVRDCDGTSYFTDAFIFGDAVVSGNTVVTTATSASDLVDADYVPLVGVDVGAIIP